MKLNEDKATIETSGDLNEALFSIDNLGMIFDILRNKMYSNPILAICREYSCNARDAHREVRKPQEPIIISLPNSLNPNYKIQDFGPGISPDRMENIFIKYTASTKRDSNLQTGGFGLGCKSGFSYSDSFTINTVVDNVRYSYACFIDETKIGKLILLSKENVDMRNSTEISIPVKPADFNLFKQYTEQACRHWDIKPIIKGGNIDFQVANKLIEGDNWAIINSTDYYNRAAKLIIDGIEYPLEMDHLRKYANPKLIDSARGNFIMYFGVGELSLSANREQIYLDKSTQEKIKNRLNEIENNLKDKVQKKINSFYDLWEANVYYTEELHDCFSSLDFLGKLYWNGNEVGRKPIFLDCKIFSFSKDNYRSHRHSKPADPNKLTRRVSNYLNFERNSNLYINDISINEPTVRHVRKAFDDNANLKNVQVICFNSKVTEDLLNNKIFLDKMNPKKLSSITKASGRVNKTSSPHVNRLIIFKYDITKNCFKQISYDSMEEDINEKVILFLDKNNYYSTINRVPILSNNSLIQLNVFSVIAKLCPNISFYGIDADSDQKRVKEEFSEFKPFEKFINSKLLNKKINFTEIAYAFKSRQVDKKCLDLINDFRTLVKKANSPFIKKLNLQEKLKKMCRDDTALLDIYQAINGNIKEETIEEWIKNNPDMDIVEVDTICKNKYPLLNYITAYNLTPCVRHIADYINMIDEK